MRSCEKCEKCVVSKLFHDKDRYIKLDLASVEREEWGEKNVLDCSF